MISNESKGKLLLFKVWTVVAIMGTGSCDTMQKDSVQSQDQVAVENNVVYITPQSSGIIDLQGMIRAYGSVKLSVDGQPKNGKLDVFDRDILKYTPNAGFYSGKDGFGISIYTKTDDFIKKDSVRIIVKRDSTGMPCGLWALNDYVYDAAGVVEVDVLDNDKLCNVNKSDIEVSMSSLSNSGALFGTTEVLANKKIRYTPGTSFAGTDQFAYRILKPENIPNQGDHLKTSYGFVYLSRKGRCIDSLKLADDQFNFTFSTLNLSDTIRLNPTKNDVICQQFNSFIIRIQQAPAGKLFVDQYPPYAFKYLLPHGTAAGFKDSFIYSLCVGEVCKEAHVKIDIN